MDSLMWKEHRISLGLEKNHKQNVIYELQNEKHEDLTTHNEIIGEMCYFYENLYDTNKSKRHRYCKLSVSSIIKTLSTTALDNCDKFSTLDEWKIQF